MFFKPSIRAAETVSMNVKWRKLLIRGSLWLTLEIILNCVGIDDMADYSEYVFERNQTTLIS